MWTLLVVLDVAADDVEDDADDDVVAEAVGAAGDHTDEANNDLNENDRLSSLVGCRCVIDNGL